MNNEKFASFTAGKFKYDGVVDSTFKFVENVQLLKPELWERFVRQFRDRSDTDGGWRGEYWGKMMRGASLVYSYTQNTELYNILKKSVEDMINSADENGRISSYSTTNEFNSWDMWCRKYVLLGLQYFLEICEDNELKSRIIDSMKHQVDYIIEKIGDTEGKKPITSTSGFWRGLNSSSILEPIVRLYELTKEEKYLIFAEYIVGCGGIDVDDIFELAYRNELFPYQYPVTKAYEMISCFEGLLEYYKITGNEKYKTAIINFTNKILESDFTIIGCCGCTDELFDHSTVRQANTTNSNVMQETCVTVTLMKFLSRVYLLTGDPKYIDALEISFYNAYLGALNTENIINSSILARLNGIDSSKVFFEPLPFDSYSPLTSGVRGIEVAGFMLLSDYHYYGCCACIGAAGVGIIPKIQCVKTDKDIALNMIINGVTEVTSPKGNPLSLKLETDYPKNGKVTITVSLSEPEQFQMLIRNPYWSENTVAFINGKEVEISKGYISLERVWNDSDRIELEFDFRTKAVYPIPYKEQVLMNRVIWEHNCMVLSYDKEDPIAHKHIALRRGPIMLAQENRLGYSVDDPINVAVDENGFVNAIHSNKEVPYPCIIKMDVPLANGQNILLTDYSSAGKLWNEESKMAVWMLTD